MSMPDLGHFANWLLNSSFKILLNSLRDSTSDIWSNDFSGKIQGFFDKVSINEMFLD